MYRIPIVFVFGSNLRGIHGAGAALFASRHCGAIYGQGEGGQGNSYALPTCSEPGTPLPLEEIKKHVETFLQHARENKYNQFQVTRVGCGYAGYTDEEIAPFFLDAPDNVWLPSAFVRALAKQVAT